MGKDNKVIAYKGFNADWTCRDFQYEIGESYEHEGVVKACGSGFHACEHPLDVFVYYSPAKSNFALVELGGDLARKDGGDSKVAASKITIKAELRLSELVEAAVKHVFDTAKWLKKSTASKDRQAASATGGQGAASATGNWGAASAKGYQGAASATGDWGAASATGDWGVASVTGYQGAASATGGRGAASATGDQGAAMASGYAGKAKGKEGCALFLCERDTGGEILNVWAGIAGRDGVKADTWYTLKDGQPQEVDHG